MPLIALMWMEIEYFMSISLSETDIELNLYNTFRFYFVCRQGRQGICCAHFYSPIDSQVWKCECAGIMGCSRLRTFFVLERGKRNMQNFLYHWPTCIFGSR